MRTLDRTTSVLVFLCLLACDEGVQDEATLLRSGPLPEIETQSCDTTYVPPTVWDPIDPVARLAGAASDCTVGTDHSPCAPHHVFTPTVGVREPLFLFLPGTNMEPDKHDQVLMTAASTGYRTIGLAYDNTISNTDACDDEPACGPNCAGRMRGEVVLGSDLSDDVEVARGDSILIRLYRLLEYLDGIDPTGGWSAYYVPASGIIHPSNIVWENIIIGGFSQGAGHAAFISRLSEVHGLFLLDGANDSCEDAVLGTLAAEWMRTGVDASDGRPKYGVRHDHGTGDDTNAVAWQALGLGTTLTSLDASGPFGSDVIDGLVPSVASSTAQGFPMSPAICSAHMSMARDECMPTDFAGATAAGVPDEARLYTVYARRMCYACDAATCP